MIYRSEQCKSLKKSSTKQFCISQHFFTWRCSGTYIYQWKDNCLILFQMYETEERRSRFALLSKTRGTDATLIIFAITSQLGGWSDVFAYVSIRDAYLPGFKILASVQFFARMWHVAILVTSGLCHAIYWPPSAASTIYLLPLLLFSSFAITRCLSFSLSLSFLFFPFLCLFLSFVLCILFFRAVSSLSVSLSFSISTIAYDRVESTLERYLCCTWTSISQTFCLDIL